MDTSDPDISFDAKGVCNHCHRAQRLCRKHIVTGGQGQAKFDQLIQRVRKEGKNKEYDSILGISGGSDSSYLAAKVIDAGLRPLAVHFDSGWNSELAVNNIERLVKALNIDLYTLVCDWREMKDLQRSYFRASVINCDVPQDHAFMAVLWKLAKKNGIKFILSGHNLATESYLPVKFRGYSSQDWKNVRSIQKKFGTRKLNVFPHVGFFRHMYYKHVNPFRVLNPLNFLDYHKEKSMEELKKTHGWVKYKGKHGESIFTRFFQGYYLPEKFGIDKRKAHYSALINSEQMSRDEAMEAVSKPFYESSSDLNEDRDFVLKKLDIMEDEWDDIMQKPPVQATTYGSHKKWYDIEKNMIQFAAKSAQKLLPVRSVEKMKQKHDERFRN